MEQNISSHSNRLAWDLNSISELTGLSVGFLRNEVRAKRLPVRRFGRRVLIRNEDLQKYLADGSPADKTSDERADP